MLQEYRLPVVLPRASGRMWKSSPLSFMVGPSLSDLAWPSLANRPITSGTILSWIGPLNGGPNNGNPVKQSRTLSPSSDVTTSSNGQIVEGLDVTGSVTIQNNNVILRQCRIKQNSTNADVVFVSGNVTGVIIEDCEIDGSKNTLQGISPNSFNLTGTVIRRNYIHGVENGVSSQHDGDAITDCFFWAFGNVGNTSYDADHIEIYATTSNGVIVRHNTFDSSNSTQANGSFNSTVNLSSVFGTLTNCVVDNNHFVNNPQNNHIINDDNNFVHGNFTWQCTNNGFVNCGPQLGGVSYNIGRSTISPDSANYFTTDITANSGTLINNGFAPGVM